MKRGDFLSYKRAEKGFSVSDLADKLNVSECEIERWEAGELPDSRYLLRLSSLLDIPVEEILRDDKTDCNTCSDNVKNTQVQLPSDSENIKSAETAPSPLPAATVTDSTKYGKKNITSGIRTKKVSVLAIRHNGYSLSERRFGYIVFAIFIVLLIVNITVHFTQKITLENYQKYIDVDVTSADIIGTKYNISVTAKKDLQNLNITMSVDIYSSDNKLVSSGIVRFKGDIKKGESIVKTIDCFNVTYHPDCNIISIDGGLD